MRGIYVSLTLLLVSANISFSQQNSEQKLSEAYQEYYTLDRESIYLHLNKTTFVKGEKIWFSCYVYDPKTQVPFTETTNLICGIYDQTGKQLEHKIFYVNKGFTMGQMEIPSELNSGEFYIKASTNWMKNFDQEEAFVQKLNIINIQTNTEPEETQNESYQVNFFPEGGHLIEDANNTIGFMVTDSKGKGVSIKNARLVSGNNTVLEKIQTDRIGIGKFGLYTTPGSNYILEVELEDNTTIAQPLPEQEKQGIIISVNNLLDDKIAVAITTNDATLAQLKDKKLYAAIHRDGLLSLNAIQLKGNKKSINLGTENLLPGINILTLFDSNLNPIAERLFFNLNRTKIGKVDSVSLAKITANDSIKVKLNLFSKNKVHTKLSVSILPNETKANGNHKSIYSSFLFDPYLKNHVINPEYYLTRTTRKKRYELDNLLITKGWSKYDWTTIFQNSPEEKFEFEDGILLSGSVSNANKRKFKLLINDEGNQYQYFTAVDSLNNFYIPNAVVFKNSKIEARLFNLKGEIFKPKLTISPMISAIKDTLDLEAFNNQFLTFLESESFMVTKEGLQEKSNNLITLDNVIVSTQKKKNKYLAIKNEGMTTVLPEAEPGTLSGFLNKIGFINSLSIYDGKFHARVEVFVDGISDNGFYNRGMEEVAEISYQKPYGPIIITTKKRKPIELVANQLLKEGFERPEIFYNPEYNLEPSQYLAYGTVYWEGQLEVNETGEHEFMIPETGLKHLKLFIEGMSEDGTLYSDIRTVFLN